MEALARSQFIPRFSETYPPLNSPSSSIRAPNKRIGSLKICDNPKFPGLRALALAREVSGGEGEESRPSDNGFGFVSEDSLSLSQVFI